MKIEQLQSKVMEIMEQKVRPALPEALVEKIIAMMPFPFIFKARSLSKSWRDKFSPISSSSIGGAEKSLAAAAFQRQVRQWSTNWKTSPVVLDYDLITYDRAAQNWVRLPSMLSFLHGDRPVRVTHPPMIEGALLYGFSSGLPEVRCGSSYVVVANLLTRSWRLLPPHVHHPYSLLFLKVMVYPSLDIYKVIIFCKKEELDYSSDDYSSDDSSDYSPVEYCVQIYSSKSGSWRSKNFKVSSGFTTDVRHVGEYLNGILYMVGLQTPQSLLAFNVEEETLQELRLSLGNNEILKSSPLNLVICNVNWLILVTKGWCEEVDREDDRNLFLYKDRSLQLFRIDLGSQQLVRLAHGPNDLGSYEFRGFPPVGVGNSLYFFKVEGYRRRLVSYNVDEDVWSHLVLVPAHKFSWNEYSSFQPGLNPFMAV